MNDKQSLVIKLRRLSSSVFRQRLSSSDDQKVGETL
jgi:hypothetical protein